MAKPKKPSWYKVVIDHGPGHQTRTVRYMYSTIREIRNQIEDQNYSWPVVKIRKVDRLPPEIKADFIAHQESNIRHAENMLRVLRATK